MLSSVWKSAGCLPVNAIVIIRPTEKLNLLKSGGAGERAGDGRVEAQECMKRSCTFSEDEIIQMMKIFLDVFKATLRESIGYLFSVDL